MVPTTEPPARSAFVSALVFGTLVIGAGLNLRIPITSVSVTLEGIAAEYGLTPVGTAVLSSLPVLMLAAGAPLAPVLDRRFGAERALVLLSLSLASSIALRPTGTIALFVGTIVAGAAISGISVLMPRVIRERAHLRPGLWSGIFSTSFGVSAAIGAGLTVPLVAFFGSLPIALASWAVPALMLVGIAVWALHRVEGRALPTRREISGPFRSTPLLWQVTVFFGCQALVFFAVTAWLPTLYMGRGLGAQDAARLLAWLSVAGLPASLLTSVVAARVQRQHVIVAIVGAASLLGLAGVTLAPVELVPSFVALLGVAQGAAFGLAVTLIVLKAQGNVAAFSAVSQGVGYGFAALGPLSLGLLSAAAVPLQVSFCFLWAVSIVQTVSGWAAGRQLVDLKAARVVRPIVSKGS